jgi:MEMO1 family protein
MAANSLVYVGIAPHPPIMVPEVGGREIANVRGSIDAMRGLTERLIASGAETVVLVSPHAPLDARAFVAYRGDLLRGDFARFRAADAEVSAPLDAELLDALRHAAAEDGFQIRDIEGDDLDHGTAVPLYFLLRNGWRGRLVALGYSYLPDDEHVRFGRTVGRAVAASKRRAAFVASGDLSHRLRPDAPAGFNPDAHLFDEQVVESLRDCAPARIAEIDPALRRLAGECGYRSMLVALGAAEGLANDCEVLHYEAPFGVGYLVAQLARGGPHATTKTEADEASASKVDARDASSGDDERGDGDVSVSSADEAERAGGAGAEARAGEAESLTKLARRAVETFVGEGRTVSAEEALAEVAPRALERPAACFVSIKTADGSLRGCIGTVEPTRGRLAEELISNAVSAATRDPRFPPVSAAELASLRYSVDVLDEPEPAEFEDLDPKVFGLIVEDHDGRRRGLLLPDIEGVETAREQLRIAARKAGIAPHEPVRLYRFRVRRFREPFSPEPNSE